MQTRWRMPPDSCAGYPLANSSSPIMSSAHATRALRSSSEIVALCRPTLMLSTTSSQGKQASSWNTTPIPLRTRSAVD